MLYINDSYNEYCTDSSADLAKWKFRSGQDSGANKISYSSVKSLILSPTDKYVGNNALRAKCETFTFDYWASNWQQRRFHSYIAFDLGSQHNLSTLNCISYKIKVTNGNKFPCTFALRNEVFYGTSGQGGNIYPPCEA